MKLGKSSLSYSDNNFISYNFPFLKLIIDKLSSSFDCNKLKFLPNYSFKDLPPLKYTIPQFYKKINFFPFSFQHI